MVVILAHVKLTWKTSKYKMQEKFVYNFCQNISYYKSFPAFSTSTDNSISYMEFTTEKVWSVL